MAATKKLLILPGDGIGPEVMDQVMRIVDWFDQGRAVKFDIEDGLVGGIAIDKEGAPIADATMAKAEPFQSVVLTVSSSMLSLM